MTWVAVQQRAWYHDKRVWIGTGAAACAVVLLMPRAQQFYRQWSGHRHVQRAAEASARGDLKGAILNGRAALAIDSRDVEALRVIAKSLEANGLQAALQYRRQLDAIRPGDPENLLAIAEDCLRAGDAAAAEETLHRLPPAEQTSARYHGLAAGVELSHGNAAAAESDLTAAIELEPREDDYRLKLAALRLDAKSPEVRAKALQDLQELSEKSTRRLVALRVLLGDATARGESARADQLSQTLAADPQATFGDKLIRLAALRSARESEFSFTSLQGKKAFYALLAQMQEAAAAKPAELYQLLTWMNEHDLALAAADWVDKLAPEIVAKPPVCVAAADACARSSAWAKLKAKIEKASWQQADFLRLAYLARALERLDDAGGSGVAWKRSLTAAQGNAACLESLGRLARQWDWAEKAEEALWKRADLPDCPRWAIDQLWGAALERHDTPQLRKASKLVLAAEPTSVTARDNYIGLSLLTGEEAAAAQKLAGSLYEENKGNALVATTYGLALYQQGQADRAVAVMAAFPPEQLHAPLVALYYGIFLAAEGQTGAAQEYLKIGEKAPQLPEEKALGDFYRFACQARESALHGAAEAAAAAWKNALGAAQTRPDWLEWLGRMALQWTWEERAEQVALKLSGAGSCPPWAAAPLWNAALKAGDSALLYKASKLISDADPNSLTLRNRYVLLSLLTRHEADAPRRLAAALHESHPADAESAATFGLSLVQQDKAGEAVAVLKALPPERLQEPRIALYYGICLAAAGQAEQAAAWLSKGAPAAQYPEEKALAGLLQLAARARALGQGADAAGAAWDQAVAAAQARPDWLEMLGRMALDWGWEEKAEPPLWKLADAGSCPKWVIDFLETDGRKKGDSAGLYKVSRLRLAADPESVPVRNDFIALSLLTHHDPDFADQLAGALYKENPGDAGVAATYGFALYQRGREKEALAVLGALGPGQLREPRIALYYGLFLAASGQQAKAEEYLALGAAGPLLPEEKALLAKAKSAVPPGSPQ